MHKVLIATPLIALALSACGPRNSHIPRPVPPTPPPAPVAEAPEPEPEPEPEPPPEAPEVTIAAIVTQQVADFAKWQAAFDAEAEQRKAASIVGHSVSQAADNPKQVTVYLAATDPTALGAFLESEEHKKVTADAGVKGDPRVTLLTPTEDSTVSEPDLAGAIIVQEVADFAAWKEKFDTSTDAQEAAGIVGHSIGQDPENANLVIVYLQAKSADELKKYTGSKDMKKVNKEAGVKGTPQVTIVKIGPWTEY